MKDEEIFHPGRNGQEPHSASDGKDRHKDPLHTRFRGTDLGSSSKKDTNVIPTLYGRV